MFISLGFRCDLAWQIRRRFDVERAFPFDWLVTPLLAITDLVTHGFERITDDLEEVEYAPNAWTIYNPTHRVYLHHEFKRAPNGRIISDWRNQVEDVAGKYRALGDRFFTTIRDTDAVTFIRWLGDFDMPGERLRQTDATQFTDLLDALQDRMKATPRLVALNCPDVPADQRIINRNVAQPTVEEMPDRSQLWKGSTIEYDALFNALLGTG